MGALKRDCTAFRAALHDLGGQPDASHDACVVGAPETRVGAIVALFAHGPTDTGSCGDERNSPAAELDVEGRMKLRLSGA